MTGHRVKLVSLSLCFLSCPLIGHSLPLRPLIGRVPVYTGPRLTWTELHFCNLFCDNWLLLAAAAGGGLTPAHGLATDTLCHYGVNKLSQTKIFKAEKIIHTSTAASNTFLCITPARSVSFYQKQKTIEKVYCDRFYQQPLYVRHRGHREKETVLTDLTEKQYLQIWQQPHEMRTNITNYDIVARFYEVPVDLNLKHPTQERLSIHNHWSK